ncbi:Molybdopterin oxidoreductase [Halalkaliarchaeum sp. AArc-CO]|uniref:molybdopterin-dependent oxidoreductase n=1 Tax=unclassified Halalkaliarchaeum TaxID=2678344 RepID=UPI00217DE037|nr:MULTISPECIES: molybdopterin-dependent oxidoreductase [unclassified Halalkaliarchaeum]MDR5672621.1 molybdopterin-dependent oxidoreductase [Halalkaliarchaeum sp. AArc-GB]UWG50424.1 Molybdopterin oxidoreductase [Halalkaliarchaeum sp. AArc-CO]
MTDPNTTDDGIERRDFMKAVGGIGAVSAASGLASIGLDLEELLSGDGNGIGTEYDEYEASDVLHTTCGQCNTFCPIQVRLADDSGAGGYSSLVRKLAGNPYSFLNTQPYAQVPYESDLDDVATGDLQGTGDVDVSGWSLSGGRICLKGQAGIQTAFDSYRVRKPIKRVGPRGNDEWKTISWEQAIEEIVEGDDELGHDGLRDMWAFAPEQEVMDDWEAVRNDEMSKAAFDEKYEDVLIDTDHPDLGPRANQIVDVGGFRRGFIRSRLWHQGLGSVNSLHHAGTCGFSGVIGYQRSHQGVKKRQYPDIENCEYLLVWGTNPMVANKGPTWLAPKLTNAIEDGMKMDVVDPRLSKTAEKADEWVPIRPGADAALALGMARWILENERYDETYLRNPDEDAAAVDDEPTWSDATHLVVVDKADGPKARAEDLGFDSDDFLVVDAETDDVVPASDAEEGALDVDRIVDGQHVKSAWTLYRERVFEYTLDEYAEMTGIDAERMVELADEFTSHGKRAAIMAYRGPAKHTNGFYNTRAISTLQHLIGNFDWKGGQITPYAGYATMSGRYELGDVPDGYSPWGIPMTRASVNYEETSLFERDGGYPAKRPWFPVIPPHAVQELYASAQNEYPYAVEALFIRPYSNNHIMASAGGDKIPENLKDEDNIGLIVASDTVLGEMSRYADYVLPEPTYLERWENFGTYPNKRLADEKISQPTVSVIPDARPFEDVLIDIWKELDLPGVGENAIRAADGERWPLHASEDFHIKLAANIAYDREPVQDASDREFELFERAHEKGLGDEFDLERWQSTVTDEEWAKVVTVLNRGGRFEDPIDGYEEAFAEHGHDYDYAGRHPNTNAYDGQHMRYKLANRVNFYDEVAPNGKHAYDGERFDPLPRVEDVKHYNGTVQVPVTSLVENGMEPDRPLQLTNWKPRTQGMTRTMGSPWLRETKSGNSLWMNPDDAAERGIENGDTVCIDAGRRTVTATVRVTGGIMPGVVGAAWGYGRDGGDTTETTIDDERRSGATDGYGHTGYRPDTPDTTGEGHADGRDCGFAVNHIAPLDEELGDAGLSDPVGGSNAQYATSVEVEPQEDG